MTTALRSPRLVFLMPLFVLIITRIGIEVSVRLLPIQVAYFTALGVYYLSVEICLLLLRSQSGVSMSWYSWSFRPLPTLKQVIIGLIIPALLPLGVLVSNHQAVPTSTFVYIFIFAAINPFFEEVFWRGVLNQLPITAIKRQLISAFLFSFSHYFLWGAYWLSNPKILIPTCITTFIMGWCWMWFYQRDGRLLYPVLSHILVDIFNLSVAVLMGMKLVGV